MGTFIFLMLDDARSPVDPRIWDEYIGSMIEKEVIRGQGAFGDGVTLRSEDAVEPGPLSRVSRYLLIELESLEDARWWLYHNPVFEAGGTIEIRELFGDIIEIHAPDTSRVPATGSTSALVDDPEND